MDSIRVSFRRIARFPRMMLLVGMVFILVSCSRSGKQTMSSGPGTGPSVQSSFQPVIDTPQPGKELRDPGKGTPQPGKETTHPSVPSPLALDEISFANDGLLFGATFSPDGKLLATNKGFDGFHLWQMNREEPREGVFVREPSEKGIRSVAYSPDGKKLATGSAVWTVRIWDVTGDEPRQIAFMKQDKNQAGVTTLAFSPDGTLLASGGRNIRLWDLKYKEPKDRGSLQVAGVGNFTTLAFAPNGKFLAGGSDDPGVHWWNMTTPSPTPLPRLQASPKTGLTTPLQVTALAFSPDGMWLAAGLKDKTIRLWDVRGNSPKEVGLIEGHRGEVFSLGFSPDSTVLVSAGGDGFFVWDIASRKPRFQKTGGDSKGFSCAALAFPGGRTANLRIAIGAYDHSIHYWKIKN